MSSEKPASSGAVPSELSAEQMVLIQAAMLKIKEAIWLVSRAQGFENSKTVATITAEDLGWAKVVFLAAKSFGTAAFSLSNLCDRIKEQFPGAKVDRAVVSRNLSDLRRKRRVPAVEVVSNDGGRWNRTYRWAEQAGQIDVPTISPRV